MTSFSRFVRIPNYPLTLSIIIVNYNVKYFLEQCLHSVQRALAGIEAEVLVVDNASTDGSVAYLRPRFPPVCFIESKSNLGFAKACNMGFLKSSGEHILFLNPDTIIAEDTLHICLHFIKTHADAGALGVRMLDGAGRFLKESKRAFPHPLTALYKLAGLARLFPNSKRFGRYHLGYLDAEKNWEVDVLAGAFMLVRRSVLDLVGLFDERFFMYGEDIDLSYRIQKRGFKNYYVADTCIIHFKGESTSTGSLNYVRLFYSAMRLFVQKHYGGSSSLFFNAAIHTAIWVRAAVAAAAKVVKWIGLPLLDFIFFLLSFSAVKLVWERAVKPNTVYPDNLLLVAFPAFALLYLAVAYYAGLYDKDYKPYNLLRAGALATLVLLAGYGLLPEGLRFSRGILVLGVLLAFAGMSALRRGLVQAGLLAKPRRASTHPYMVVAGSVAEYEHLKKLLEEDKGPQKIIGRLAVTADDTDSLGQLAQTATIAPALNAEELVLCGGTVTNRRLIQFIEKEKLGVRLRFHAAGSSSLVGADCSTASGEAVSATTFFALAQPPARRVKRLVDVTASLFLLLLFPLHFFVVQKPLRLLANAVLVLLGKKTWVGYSACTLLLPPLRPAVLAPDGRAVHGVLKKLDASHATINYWYAQNWSAGQDVALLVKNYAQLGG